MTFINTVGKSLYYNLTDKGVETVYLSNAQPDKHIFEGQMFCFLEIYEAE